MYIYENDSERERSLSARWTFDGAPRSWRKANDPQLRASLYVADFAACRPLDLAKNLEDAAFRSVVGQVEQVVLVGDSGCDPEGAILDKTVATLLLRVPASFTYMVEGTKGEPGDERVFRELGLVAAHTFLPGEFGRREVSYGRDHFVFACDRSLIRGAVLKELLGTIRNGAPVPAYGPAAWDEGFLRTWLRGVSHALVSDKPAILQHLAERTYDGKPIVLASISAGSGEPAGLWVRFLSTNVPGADVTAKFASMSNKDPAEECERARYLLERSREEADRAEELEWEIEARAFRLAKQIAAKGGAQ